MCSGYLIYVHVYVCVYIKTYIYIWGVPASDTYPSSSLGSHTDFNPDSRREASAHELQKISRC